MIMNTFEEIKVLLREKSGKKLVRLSVIAFLVVTVLVFFMVFRFFGTFRLKQMDEYLGEIPGIIESRTNELLMRSRVYQEDVLARAELGMILCNEEYGFYTEAEMLERIRNAVFADSVSLVDGQGELLSTTGPVCPEETFRARIRTLEPRQPGIELYPALSEDGKETGEKDGRGFVLLPIEGNSKRSLVFEFSCDMMLKLYNTLDDWSSVFERMFSGEEGIAFVKTGDKLAGYPTDILTGDQASQLKEELTRQFQDSSSFRKTGSGIPFRIITLLGRMYLAAMMDYPDQETSVLMALPLQYAISNSIYIAASISAFIGCGILLLQIYILRRLLLKKEQEKSAPVSRASVCRTTLPGILVMLAMTLIFSYMLLELENRSDATYTAVSKRVSVQYEIDARKGQENTIRETFEDCYRTRAQILAAFLTEHPDYQTRAGLARLSGIAGTEYLMRFDSAGQEIVSSNSYTGFSVEKNLSEEYQAVLLGYPYAVARPAEDPYSGKMQLGTAILMTDGNGQSDGFLLAVYSASDLNSELKRMSYTNAVNSFAVQNGHIAAAISEKDNVFIAHTDPKMIGQKAGDFLNGSGAGGSFEGFTEYNGRRVCVSASSSDGKTLLYIVPEHTDPYADWICVLAGVLALLILTLAYYPNAGLLIAQAMAETKEEIQPLSEKARPMAAFSDGYSVFLTLFAFFAVIASANGWWTSFDYVFSGLWSKGVHLFSIWAALFVVAVTLCVVFLIRSVLSRLENRLSVRAGTVARLVNSLITYAASFFLLFYILSMFGVNTTVLLASAGVVSIAVGMGAQSMAADLLAGFFMMLEGTVHVGDYVDIQKIRGKVVDMGIRTIKIADETGNVVTLNNSKASPVRNMGRKPEQSGSENKAEGSSPGGDDDD